MRSVFVGSVTLYAGSPPFAATRNWPWVSSYDARLAP